MKARAGLRKHFEHEPGLARHLVQPSLGCDVFYSEAFPAYFAHYFPVKACGTWHALMLDRESNRVVTNIVVHHDTQRTFRTLSSLRAYVTAWVREKNFARSG